MHMHVHVPFSTHTPDGNNLPLDAEKPADVLPDGRPSSHSDSTHIESPSSSESEKKPEAVEDPNLVTWDGDDDPENPKNWPIRRKWAVSTHQDQCEPSKRI